MPELVKQLTCENRANEPSETFEIDFGRAVASFEDWHDECNQIAFLGISNIACNHPKKLFVFFISLNGSKDRK